MTPALGQARAALLGALLLVTSAGSAAAQGAPPPADTASVASGRGGPPTATVATLELAGDVTTSLRLSDRLGGARVAAGRARVALGAEVSPWTYVRLSVDLGAERAAHDWRHPERLGSPEVSLGEEPWDEVQLVSAALGAQLFLGPRWSLLARVGLSAGVEPGAALEDGLSASFALSAGLRLDETLTLGAGLLALARLEDSPLVVPILFVRWTPTPGFVLETAGPGLRASLQVARGLDLSLRAAFELRQWRLEDRRARLSGAVVQDTRVVAAVGLAWRPTERATLRAELGVYPYTELRIIDRRGDDVRRLQGELGGVGSLGVELSF